MTLKDQRVRNRIEFAGPDSEDVRDVLSRLESGPNYFTRGMVWWLTMGKMRAAAAPAFISWNARPYPELPVLVPDRGQPPASEAAAARRRAAAMNWIKKLSLI